MDGESRGGPFNLIPRLNGLVSDRRTPNGHSRRRTIASSTEDGIPLLRSTLSGCIHEESASLVSLHAYVKKWRLYSIHITGNVVAEMRHARTWKGEMRFTRFSMVSNASHPVFYLRVFLFSRYIGLQVLRM